MTMIPALMGGIVSAPADGEEEATITTHMVPAGPMVEISSADQSQRMLQDGPMLDS